ncbi:MAG: pyruvate, phosphate dikinase [Spirochaetes bacterium]|jgi:pyruvate,orthophosphate dikinase|nr:pyruvate, phosphate dikinase [Spirochaetota bacterium]
MAKKYVYFFGGGEADGNAQMKETLGGKGAGLAEMTRADVPVPAGFTISTDVCEYYYDHDETYPDGLEQEVQRNLDRLESMMGKTLGDPKDPLLVSVRSGAAVSMPGMMDTVLNLGLNDEAVDGLAQKSGNERFAWDSYRRFINMFGDVVMGVKHEEFEKVLERMKKNKGVENDTDLDAADLKKLVTQYKKVYKENTGAEFPQDPKDQMWKTINAVFGSWNNPRAINYRKLNDIKGLKGTAVTVMSMVFGNFGEDSGTGVCFSRDPSTGEKVFYGEYLMNAQGEDVVAGIRTPMAIKTLSDRDPKIYKQLVEVKDKLERHYQDMQDMEFTIEQGKLYLLQTRNGKRTGVAAVKIAVDMVNEGLIDKEKAMDRVTPAQLDQVFHPMIDPKAAESAKSLTKGLNASPGAATGQVVFTADEAEQWVKDGKKVLLARKETSPEDIGGMHAAEGVLTSTGGMTSHAAVVARGMGTPCVVGAKGVVISGKTMMVGEKKFKQGDFVTIDGTTGNVYEGALPLMEPKISGELRAFLEWTDDVRNKARREGLEQVGFNIRTNADTPEDAQRAREFGAEGIGLCRTEHMFFEEDRIKIFRQMIVAENKEARQKALDKLMPLQKEDFAGIFKAMDGLPVTIRLLDPPLHEFVPAEKEAIKELAESVNVSVPKLKAKIDSLHEANPMLGHRGTRLGITYPEVYNMQVEAIMTAACEVAKQGVKVYPEIMIPLVGTVNELDVMRKDAEQVAERVLEEKKMTIEYMIGTMIEIPRAALTADEVAKRADFFSFGTNDLTQMTFGYSRDDIGSFLPQYLEDGILEDDPFAVLDQEGVGQLVKMGTEKGRQTNPKLKVGICGEHGGEPRSIEFCYRVGMNYVSCSPFRVPIARLAAAKAVAHDEK